MLEGVGIIVGINTIFAKQNYGHFIETFDSAPSDAARGLCPSYDQN